MKIIDSRSLLKRLVEVQTCVWVLVVFGILAYGYLGKIWSEVLIFRVDDGWCEPGQGIGNHCFGDFGMPYGVGSGNSFYEKNNPAAMNSPLTNLVFVALGKLNYDFALVTYLAMLLVAAFLPFVAGRSSFPLGFRLQTATLFGLISVGSLAAIDRGNHILIVASLLFGYLISVEKRNWTRATVLLILISLLKFWGIVLVVLLIAKSRYRNALTAVFLTPVLTIMLLIPFSGSLSDTTRVMLEAVVNREYGNVVARYSISIQGLFRRTVCSLETGYFCSGSDDPNGWTASVYFSIAILVVLLLLVLIIIKNSSQTPHVWMLFVASIGVVGIPEGPIYQLALTSGAVAAILSLENYKIGENWVWTTRALIVSVVVSSTPFSLQFDRYGKTHLFDDYVFRSYHLVVPLCWLASFIIASIELLRIRSFEIAREEVDL